MSILNQDSDYCVFDDELSMILESLYSFWKYDEDMNSSILKIEYVSVTPQCNKHTQNTTRLKGSFLRLMWLNAVFYFNLKDNAQKAKEIIY